MLINNFSQQQKILTTMCRAKPDKWFFPYDFMSDDLGDLFVGYEASARLSELAHDYPEMVESERAGKYIRRRLKLDKISEWLPLLPKDLRYIIHRAGLTRETDRVRRPRPQETTRPSKVEATYRGRPGLLMPKRSYELIIGQLQMGLPISVEVINPDPTAPSIATLNYQNINAFTHDWGTIS